MTVTEAEWETCIDPAEMYRFIRFRPGVIRSKAGRRKLRLFGVACCRKMGRLISDSRSLAAIEVAERLADGHALQEEVSLAEQDARQAYEEAFEAWLSDRSGSQVIVTPERSALSAMLLLDRLADNYGQAGLCRHAVNTDAPDYRTYRKRGQWQADVLRCVFGNPFRPMTINPAWLSWNDGTVRKVARAIYDERAFDRLPILADTLEEAGCTDPVILAHCLSGGEHVRGCWVIDLVLGKA
jgi:hypothetical protein